MGRLGLAIIIVVVAITFFILGMQYKNFNIKGQIEYCEEKGMAFGYGIDINGDVRPICNCWLADDWQHGLDGMGG